MKPPYDSQNNTHSPREVAEKVARQNGQRDVTPQLPPAGKQPPPPTTLPPVSPTK